MLLLAAALGCCVIGGLLPGPTDRFFIEPFAARLILTVRE